MSDQTWRTRLQGTTARAIQVLQGPPPSIDASGDSEEARRYRRFFATHDINGLPQREARSRR